jgi:hypothetical protein
MERPAVRRNWILGSATGLFLVAALVVALQIIGTGSRVICPESTDPNWNPYSGTAAQATACGLTVYPLIGTTKLPDGGTRYVYQESGGNTTTENVPPKGFNVLDASPAERALYGIPSEPPVTNATAYAHWLLEVAGIKHFVQPPPFLYSVPDMINLGLQQSGS